MQVCGERIAADIALKLIAEDNENEGFNPEGKNPEVILNLSKTLYSNFSLAQNSFWQNFLELLQSTRQSDNTLNHSKLRFYQQLN